MATDSVAASAAPESSGVVDKGLKKSAIGYLSNVVIGVASTAPAYSLAATLGFIVAVNGVGVHAPAVLLVSFVPMLLIAAGLQIPEPRRPRRRHDVRVDDARIWPGDGLGQRLGDLPRRRDRDGLARRHRGDLHVQALRLHRTRRIQSRDHRRRGHLDRADDVDLLPRHRALGAHPAVPAQRRDPDPRNVRGGRLRQGLRRPSARLDQALAVVVQPVRDELQRPGRRAAARRLHLLGLGLRRGGQRGVRGPRRGPGQGGGRLDDPARRSSTSSSPPRPRPSTAPASSQRKQRQKTS